MRFFAASFLLLWLGSAMDGGEEGDGRKDKGGFKRFEEDDFEDDWISSSEDENPFVRQCKKCGKHAYLRKGVCANPSCRKWFGRLPGQGWWNQRGGGSSSSWEVPPVLPPPATPPILFPQPPAAPPPGHLFPGPPPMMPAAPAIPGPMVPAFMPQMPPPGQLVPMPQGLPLPMPQPGPIIPWNAPVLPPPNLPPAGGYVPVTPPMAYRPEPAPGSSKWMRTWAVDECHFDKKIMCISI